MSGGFTMRILISLCTAAVMASASTLLGTGIEVDYYNPIASGDFSYTDAGTTTRTHFNDDSQSVYQIGVYIEHPVPFLPNIRVDLTPKTTFSGLDGTTVSKVSISQTDIIPYYEILDNVVDFDLGVAFRVFDGNIEGTVKQSISQVIPMGYAAVGVDIPGMLLRIAGDIKYAGYNGDSLSDMRIKAIWKIMAGIQVQAGYRQGSLDINNHFDLNSNVKIKGPFVGLGCVF